MAIAPEPVPPIIVFGRDDLLIFDNIASAELYIEAVDVKDGEYVAACDSRGLRMKLEGAVREHKLLGLRLVESEPVRLAWDDPELYPTNLEEMLKQYLVKRGVNPTTLADASLAHLIAVANAKPGQPR